MKHIKRSVSKLMAVATSVATLCIAMSTSGCAIDPAKLAEMQAQMKALAMNKADAHFEAIEAEMKMLLRLQAASKRPGAGDGVRGEKRTIRVSSQGRTRSTVVLYNASVDLDRNAVGARTPEAKAFIEAFADYVEKRQAWEPSVLEVSASGARAEWIKATAAAVAPRLVIRVQPTEPGDESIGWLGTGALVRDL